ncbi:MAG: Hsp20/alpha crystallin family protein [Cohnella sp.]|nr:Hsp20/alpha crystallin family protein [Cohnella sp.]
MDKKEKRIQPTDFLSQTIDVLGEDFWQEMGELIPNTGPRFDIYYTSTSVVVLAELPDLQTPDQIGIRLEGQTLVVEGEIPRLYPVTENRISRNERFFGPFRRSLLLPKPVSADGIKAKYRQGLLIIELRIEPLSEQKNIPVEFG